MFLVTFNRVSTLTVHKGVGGRICQYLYFQLRIEDGVKYAKYKEGKKQKKND